MVNDARCDFMGKYEYMYITIVNQNTHLITQIMTLQPDIWALCYEIAVGSRRYLLLWRHNGRDGVSNHQPHDCLLNRSLRWRSKKTPKLRVTGLCKGNSPVKGEFPVQMTRDAENVSIWWRHPVQRIVSVIRIQFPEVIGAWKNWDSCLTSESGIILCKSILSIKCLLLVTVLAK